MSPSGGGMGLGGASLSANHGSRSRSSPALPSYIHELHPHITHDRPTQRTESHNTTIHSPVT